MPLRAPLVAQLVVAALRINSALCVHMYECHDKLARSECHARADKNQCLLNAKFMWPHCCKTCVSVCTDTRNDCPQLSKRGGCAAHDILLACQQTCGLCCRDYHPECPEWALKGQCAKNSSFLLGRCMKSCQACSSPCKPCSNDQYENTTTIQGFTVHAEVGVFHRWPKLMWALEEDLGKLKSVVPLRAVQLLQKYSGLFISKLKVCSLFPRCTPATVADSYHVSRRHLVSTGDAPAKTGFVELMNPGEYMYRRSSVEKYNLLHEFFHAWFDIRRRAAIAGDSDSRAKVKAVEEAYDAAKATGLYRSVRYAGGGMRPGYQIQSHWEYMGELSEAYFARGSDRNDYYPFNRQELSSFDPRGFGAIRAMWSAPYPGKVAPAGANA